MFSLNDSMRYLLYSEPTDMRKSYHRLSDLVRNNMSVSVGNIKQITCADAANGEATVYVSGGVVPYVYKWYKRQLSTDILVYEGSSTVQNLAPGTYFVTVRNDNGNGCMVKSSFFTITEPGELKIVQPIEVTD